MLPKFYKCASDIPYLNIVIKNCCTCYCCKHFQFWQVQFQLKMMYANKKSSYQWMVPSLCASWKLIGKTLAILVFSLNSLVKKHGNLTIIHGHFEAYHSLSCFLFVFRIIDFLCVIQRFCYLVKMIYLLKEFQVKKRESQLFHATMYILIILKLIIIKIKSDGSFQSNYVFAIDI